MSPTDCGFQPRILRIRTNIVRQFPDEIAEIGRELRPQTGIAACIANHALQIAQCILAQRCGFKAVRSDDETFDPCRLFAQPKSRGPGLGKEVIRRCQQFTVQRGSSRQLDPACEKTAL